MAFHFDSHPQKPTTFIPASQREHVTVHEGCGIIAITYEDGSVTHEVIDADGFSQHITQAGLEAAGQRKAPSDRHPTRLREPPPHGERTLPCSRLRTS